MGLGLVQRRLEDIQRQIRHARESEAILKEQVAEWNDSLEELRIRALVSETPLQAAEYEELAKHVLAARRELERRQSEISKMIDRRDNLLRQWQPKE